MDEVSRRARSVRWIGICATEEMEGGDGARPAEADLVATASPQRRREFLTGRACARRALNQVGAPSQAAVLVGLEGAPVWPAGFLGSITHTNGWTGAVATRSGWRRGVRGIGLDAEASSTLPPGVLGVIASSVEREQLERLATDDSGPAWDVVLFSVKEAVYKAVYPLTGEVLSHDDVAVDLRADGGFTATARTPGGGTVRRRRVRGAWGQGPRVVVSLAVVD